MPGTLAAPSPSPEGKGAGVEAAATSLPSLHTPSPSGRLPDLPYLSQPSCVLSSSLTHCSPRNIPIQVARGMTALPGHQAVAQNKSQPSFLLAAFTQVQGQASQGMARLRHTSPSGQGLSRGSGARRPVSLALPTKCQNTPLLLQARKAC